VNFKPKKKTFSKFAIYYVIGVFVMLVFASAPINKVQAECKPSEGAIILSIPIPGLPLTPVSGCNKWELKDDPPGTALIEYIKGFYRFFVGVAGIIAVFMIMFGGIQWLFSGGSPGMIGSAKETIFGAVIGLLIAVGSYGVLQIINPQLVKLKLKVTPVEVIPPGLFEGKGCCDMTDVQSSWLFGDLAVPDLHLAKLVETKRECENMKGKTFEEITYRNWTLFNLEFTGVYPFKPDEVVYWSEDLIAPSFYTVEWKDRWGSFCDQHNVIEMPPVFP